MKNKKERKEKRGVSFLFQAEDGIRDIGVTGVQTCALPIYETLIIKYLKSNVVQYIILLDKEWLCKAMDTVIFDITKNHYQH